MQEAERPLGLGILAVISFAAALWNIYSAATLVLLVAGVLKLPEQPELLAAYAALSEWFRWFVLAMAIAKAAFLVPAGVGYFARRRYGRFAGTGYAVLSIVESATAFGALGYFGRESIIAVLFAVYTLVAVNTRYRSVLTR
jgi:hypothetical protein